MRETIRDIDRLRHIDECIEHINDYLNGKSFEDMTADIMCYHAVVYNIMIIGEAANLLTKDFREKHPEVPWRDIVDMRNALVHGYITTNANLILTADAKINIAMGATAKVASSKSFVLLSHHFEKSVII